MSQISRLMSGRSLITTQVPIGGEGRKSMVRPLPPRPINDITICLWAVAGHISQN